MTARWTVALRLAWRLTRRAPGRSALVATLVALPVLAGTFAAVTVRTAELSPAQAAQRFIGAADAVAVVTPYQRVDPAHSVLGYAGGYASGSAETTVAGSGRRTSGGVDLARLLPAGAHAIPAGWQRYLQVSAGDRRAQVPAVLLDLADPLTRGMYDVSTGHAPGVGEVAVTTALARRLGIHVGSSVAVGTATRTVSALVRDPADLSAEQVVGPAGSLGGPAAFPGRFARQDLTWLIGYPARSAPDLHVALAAYGVIYETRERWEHPPADLVTAVHVNAQGRAILASIAGFGIAEIVLLAGTAFAVGVRRQVRTFGLLRANGGDERDVRRVVLAKASVLGGLGAVAGVGLGFLGVVLARPLLEQLAGRAFGPLEGRPIEILGVALLGVVAAVLAAIVPARTTARLALLDMLRTRFHVDVRAARTPRWAVLALVAGPALVVAAAAGWHATSGGAQPASLSVGGVVAAIQASSSHDAGWTALISLGAAVALAGIARSCPALVTRLGRRAGSMPVSLRLAARDAARHRHRTAPAIAAVTTVVSGAVLVLMVLSSTTIKDRRDYLPLQPVGTVSVSMSGPHTSAADIADATREVAARLGGGASAVLGRAELTRQRANDRVGVHAPGCNIRTSTCDIGPVGVGDTTLVATMAGRPEPAATAGLASGAAVVLDGTLVHSGHVLVDEVRFRHGRLATTSVSLPATVVDVADHGDLPTVIVSPTTASAHGWTVVTVEGLVRPVHVPSQRSADRLSATLGTTTGLYVERGFRNHLDVLLLGIVGATALAVVIGTSIAVALALAESRADMATLAAVGAAPGRRRLLAMGQAATIGSLGSVLGLPLGLLVGIALLQGSTAYPFTMPVRWLALLVLAAPALAVGVAGVATRSRVPLTRRLD